MRRATALNAVCMDVLPVCLILQTLVGSVRSLWFWKLEHVDVQLKARSSVQRECAKIVLWKVVHHAKVVNRTFVWSVQIAEPFWLMDSVSALLTHSGSLQPMHVVMRNRLLNPLLNLLFNRIWEKKETALKVVRLVILGAAQNVKKGFSYTPKKNSVENVILDVQLAKGKNVYLFIQVGESTKEKLPIVPFLTAKIVLKILVSVSNAKETIFSETPLFVNLINRKSQN